MTATRTTDIHPQAATVSKDSLHAAPQESGSAGAPVAGKIMRRRAALKYTIECRWDDDGRVWIATSPDIIGLVMCGETLADAFVRAAEILPDLMPLNNQKVPHA